MRNICVSQFQCGLVDHIFLPINCTPLILFSCSLSFNYLNFIGIHEFKNVFQKVTIFSSSHNFIFFIIYFLFYSSSFWIFLFNLFLFFCFLNYILFIETSPFIWARRLGGALKQIIIIMNCRLCIFFIFEQTFIFLGYLLEHGT